MIVNDTFRVFRMMPQIGVSLMIANLMNQEVSVMLPELSIMLLENNHSTGITRDGHHLGLSYLNSTDGEVLLKGKVQYI
jgi:hypothetical protein